MGKRHLTAELVLAWLENRADMRELLKILVSHVVEDCPTCDEAWRSATQGRIPGSGLLAQLQHEFKEDGASAAQAIAKAIRRVASMRDTVLESASAEDLEARAQELLRLPVASAIDVIQRSRKKYVHPRLAKLLLERCQRVYGLNPKEMLEVSRRAEAVAVRARDLREVWKPFAVDLHAMSLVFQGNALRLQGDYSGAREQFQFARAVLDHGSGDPIVFADVAFHGASLSFDEYRFEDALREARQAAKIYARSGEEHRVGLCLMKLAVVQAETGDAGSAVGTLRDAMEKLDYRQEPELEILVYENLALYLAEAGDPQRALEVLSQHPLDPRRNRRSLLKRDWIEARIQIVLGESMAAAATLANLREDFARIDDRVSAAIVSLDLALIFAERGYPEEVKKLAEETLPMLQSMAVPQEIWAALLLFKQAADAENATQVVLEEVRDILSDRRRWREKAVEN